MGDYETSHTLNFSRVELTDCVLCCRALEERLVERWKGLSGRNASECARVYLNVCRRWPLFGAKLFNAQVSLQSSLYMYILARNRLEACNSVRVRLSCRDDNLSLFVRSRVHSVFVNVLFTDTKY